MVDLAKKYSESKLRPNTEGYLLHNRKKLQDFDAYDLEEAFSEGQKNPIWNYDCEPDHGTEVIIDDLYYGITTAYLRSDGEWVDRRGHKCNPTRWMKLPK